MREIPSTFPQTRRTSSTTLPRGQSACSASARPQVSKLFSRKSECPSPLEPRCHPNSRRQLRPSSAPGPSPSRPSIEPNCWITPDSSSRTYKETESARRQRTLGRFRKAGDFRLTGDLRGLGAFLGGLHLCVDGLHPLAGLGDALAAVWCSVDQLLEAGGKLRAVRCPDFAEERLDLGEDADVLAVAVGEKFQADGAVFDQRGGHLPIADHHTQIGAIFTKHRGVEVRKRLGIEVAKIPIAGVAHLLFAAEIVEFEDEPCFFLF